MDALAFTAVFRYLLIPVPPFGVALVHALAGKGGGDEDEEGEEVGEGGWAHGGEVVELAVRDRLGRKSRRERYYEEEVIGQVLAGL
jgi:hypothetical protein